VPSFWEKVQVDGQDMDVYISVPSGSGPFPAIVIAHPASGVGEFTQSIADRLAAAGFAAVAPDRFHRVTKDMLADGSAAGNFSVDAEVIADYDATVDFLRNHSAIDGQRIGVMGFCSGGRMTWLAAASNPHFKAAVPYYGGNIMAGQNAAQSPFDLTGGINCPTLFHFGDLDTNPSQEDLKKLDAELTRLGKQHTFYTYPGAGHAFMDHTLPEVAGAARGYNKEAADASWPRTLDFLASHLKGAEVRS